MRGGHFTMPSADQWRRRNQTAFNIKLPPPPPCEPCVSKSIWSSVEITEQVFLAKTRCFLYITLNDFKKSFILNLLYLYYRKVANSSPMLVMKKKDHTTCRLFLYHKFYFQVINVMEYPNDKLRCMYL